MLSRVAERMYWLGRYLERAENTARMVGVNAAMLLDRPRGAQFNWRALVVITGSEPIFVARPRGIDERAVVSFLLAEPTNPGSLIASLTCVRENARTTREILSSDAWEAINDLYLFVKDEVASGIARSSRPAFLNTSIATCQKVTGVISDTMSHDHAFTFIWLGRMLERADMTTRILDMGSTQLLPETAAENTADEHTPFEDVLWASVLRSLGAYQMYRRHVQGRISGRGVIQYLLRDKLFPRSVAHCLLTVQTCVRGLPHHTPVLRLVKTLQQRLDAIAASAVIEAGLHDRMDELQSLLGDLHSQIATTWLNSAAADPDPDRPSMQRAGAEGARRHPLDSGPTRT